MKTGLRMVAACALTVASVAASGDESHFYGSFASLADSESGRSNDFDLSFAPNTRLSFDAGVGMAQSRSDLADIEGTSLRAAVDVHSERFGLRGYYRSWSDSNNFDTDTIGVQASIRNGGFGFSVIAETRGFDVDYTTGTVLNSTRSTASFDGTGYGAGASYGAAGWNGYVQGVFYDYGSQLQRYTNAAGAPNLLGIPLVPGLTGSFITLNQGALDRQLSAGVERGFERSSVRLDWTGVEDAISGAQSDTFSTGFRYSFTERLNIGLTLGVTDSDFGSVNFGGLSFGFNH